MLGGNRQAPELQTWAPGSGSRGGKVGGGEGGVMDAGEGWAAQSTDPSHLEGPRTASQSRQHCSGTWKGKRGESVLNRESSLWSRSYLERPLNCPPRVRLSAKSPLPHLVDLRLRIWSKSGAVLRGGDLARGPSPTGGGRANPERASSAALGPGSQCVREHARCW